MHTTHKQKSAGPPVGLGRQYGITDREYFALGKFSNDTDKLGLKTVSIGKAFGLGCRLKLSGKADYELLLNNGIMLLGRIEGDGKRVKLAEAGTNIEANWENLLGALRKSEGRPS